MVFRFQLSDFSQEKGRIEEKTSADYADYADKKKAGRRAEERIHMDGQDKNYEVLSFQLSDFSKRKKRIC